MSKLFNTDGQIYKVMQLLYNLLILNFLFLLSILPIFTIGASLTAAYTTAFKIIDKNEGKVFNTYLSSLKKDFKKSTVIFILNTLLLTSLLCLIRFCYQINQFFFFFSFLLLSYFLLYSFFVFPLIAKFDNTIFQTIKNSFFLTINNISYCILVFTINILGLFALPFFIPRLFFLWLFLGISVVIYLSALIFNKIFGNYID